MSNAANQQLSDFYGKTFYIAALFSEKFSSFFFFLFWWNRYLLIGFYCQIPNCTAHVLNFTRREDETETDGAN